MFIPGHPCSGAAYNFLPQVGRVLPSGACPRGLKFPPPPGMCVVAGNVSALRETLPDLPVVSNSPVEAELIGTVEC